jgi:hypothetical protein
MSRIRDFLRTITCFYGTVVHAVAVSFLVAVCIGCVPAGPQQAQGGTGSEIVGKAEYPDSTTLQKRFVLGAPAAAAAFPVVRGKVFVYTSSFIPDTSWATTGALPRVYSDSAGAFHVYDVPHGPVIVEVNDGSGRGAKDTITIDRDSTRYDIGVLDLGPTGGAKIQAQTSLPGKVRFYVSVRGTRLTVRGNQAGVDVMLSDIPAGTDYTVSIRVYEPVYLSLDIPNVSISAGVTTALQTFTIQ